jgi:hypothetical protein
MQYLYDLTKMVRIDKLAVEAENYCIKIAFIFFPPTNGATSIADKSNFNPRFGAKFTNVYEIFVEGYLATCKLKIDLFFWMDIFYALHKGLYIICVMPFMFAIMKTLWTIRTFKIACAAKTPIDYKPIVVVGI